MPDPWTAAWAEAEASAPAGLVTYETLELQHPAFVDGGGNPIALRIIAGTADDQVFTLEAGAPLNGGQAVTFTAIPFTSEFPEVAEGRLPQSRIRIDNVAREFVPLIEQAVTYRADLTATYRQYRSDDVAEPAYGPVTFQIRNATMVGATIEGMAQLQNLANVKFPSKLYTIDNFPGLL